MSISQFYKLKKWEHKRERILKRDKYLCQECKRYGKTTQATTVHHIIANLERGGMPIGAFCHL